MIYKEIEKIENEIFLRKNKKVKNFHSGTPAVLKFQNGVEINYMAQNIQEELTDDVHIWVVFKDDMLEGEKAAGGKDKKKGGMKKK